VRCGARHDGATHRVTVELGARPAEPTHSNAAERYARAGGDAAMRALGAADLRAVEPHAAGIG